MTRTTTAEVCGCCLEMEVNWLMRTKVDQRGFFFSTVERRVTLLPDVLPANDSLYFLFHFDKEGDNSKPFSLLVSQ